MSAKGILFLAGLALAPFTVGLSLLLSAFVLFVHCVSYKDGTGIDDSQFPDILSAAEESAARLERITAEAPARRQRQLQAHYDAMEAAQPPAYATYRCSNSMCRHTERLLTWHDNHECEVCGWATWRVN